MKHLGIIATAVFLLSLSIAEGAIGARDYVSVSITPGAISWRPLVDNGGISLSIAGPHNTYIGREYKAGVAPSIGPEDVAGNPLPDGQYSYQLQFTPPDGTVTRSANEFYTAPSDLEPMTQSGTFRVINGQFFVPSTALEEPVVQPQANAGTVTPLDVVYADDLIVQGSLCAGFGCVDNEDFGFDTIRLRENNCRIKFDDASTEAGFSANDWQLTANDSFIGGASYFSIDDITGVKTPFRILAGAPTDSLFVSSSGNVGIRTSTPAMGLQITYGNTPGVRLEQDTSMSFTAQTWDVAGHEGYFFIRDVTNGSKLPFIIRSDAPENSIYINSNGNVGIGMNSPQYLLDVNGEARAEGIIIVSSRASKDNIVGLKSSEAMEALKRLNPVRFTYKTDETEGHVGFIAEEVPDLVAKNGRTGIDPMDIVAVLTKVVKEQNKAIYDQQEAIEELKNELASLKRAINSIGNGNIIGIAYQQ